MAIKGKKKSQSRGSQARRRPAAAPRQVPISRRRTPWYRTKVGIAVAAVGGVIVLGAGIALFANARSNHAELVKRQDGLETYTGKVRALLQSVTPAASEMAAVPTDADDAKAVDDLEKQSPGWVETFDKASKEAAKIVPPANAEDIGAAEAGTLFSQSVELYASAARTYVVVPQAPGKLRVTLLARGAEQRDSAAAVWSSAVRILDANRADAELEPSGLRAPASAPASSPVATPAPTVPVNQVTAGAEAPADGKAARRGKNAGAGARGENAAKTRRAPKEKRR